MPRREFSLGLFTDLYELTMAQAYWQSGKTAQATFSLFFRNYPPDRAYFVFAGLQDILEYLEGFQFTSDDIAFLRTLKKFDDGFLSYLGKLRFTGSVVLDSQSALSRRSGWSPEGTDRRFQIVGALLIATDRDFVFTGRHRRNSRRSVGGDRRYSASLAWP